MDILLKIPEQTVMAVMYNPSLSGGFNDRIMQILDAYQRPSTPRSLPRRQALEEIKEKIRPLSPGTMFSFKELASFYVLSHGNRRQLGKELAALRDELKFAPVTHELYDYIKVA